MDHHKYDVFGHHLMHVKYVTNKGSLDLWVRADMRAVLVASENAFYNDLFPEEAHVGRSFPD